MENLKDNIAKCVLGNVKFRGSTPGVYTIQDCFNETLTITSIKNIAMVNNKRLKALNSDDLFDTKEDPQKKTLQLVVDTLVDVVKYKEELSNRAKKAAATRKANAEKLATLKAIKTEKEVDNLKGEGLENIKKMIAELEGVLED